MRTYVLRKNLIILSGCLAMGLILTGCGVTRYDTKESTKILLPTIVQYSEKETRAAIEEVSGGSCPVHVEFAKDYVQIRDRLRLIKKELN